MAGISSEDIQKVREANDLVQVFAETVPVKQKGRDFWCCCPFHNEHTPSCKIDPAAQLWHCFGCGEGGDLFAYIMKRDEVGFVDAVKYLADRANVEITEQQGAHSMPQNKKARLKQACEEAAQFYNLQLMRSPAQGASSARSYLAGRNFGGEICKRWNLGFAPGSGTLVSHLLHKGFTPEELQEANLALVGRDNRLRDRFFNRVMFPICDVKGECIAFGGRVIGQGEPKYLNSQETPIFHKSEQMFGLHRAKAEMTSSGVAVVVEGYTDVITLHEAGITNVVATLGTALTKQHIRILSRHAKHKIIYLFDGDEAGMRAADRALEFIDMSMTPEAGRRKIDVYAAVLPDKLDPSDFVQQRGPEALREIFNNAQPLLEYGIDRRLERYDLSNPVSKQKAVLEALAVLAPIKESLLAKEYAIRIAGKAHLREEDVLDQLEQLQPPRAYSSEEHAFQENAAPVQRKVQLTPAQDNRRKIEGQFLANLCRNLALAPDYFSVLASTQWMFPIHRRISSLILESLAENSDQTTAELVGSISLQEPQAASILTAQQAQADMNPCVLLSFLAEDLAIGDTEEAISALQQQLKYPENISREEYAMLFEAVVSMQKDLQERKLRHKPSIE